MSKEELIKKIQEIQNDLESVMWNTNKEDEELQLAFSVGLNELTNIEYKIKTNL